MAERTFARRISRLRRRFMIRAVLGLLADGLLFASVPAAALALIDHVGWAGASADLYRTSAAAAFFLGAGFSAWRKRAGFFGRLIEAEARLGIKEVLSTADEYLRLGLESVYLARLFDEASKILETIGVDRLLPRIIRPIHALIPALLLVFLLAAPVPEAVRPRPGHSDREKVSLIKKAFDAWTGRPETRERAVPGRSGPNGDSTDRRAGRIPEFGKDFLDSLRELEKQVRAERTRSARKLAESLSLGDVSGLPALRPLLEESELDPEEFERLSREIEKMFQGESPEALREALSGLEEKIRFEQFLKDAIEDQTAVVAGNAPDASSGAGGHDEEALVAESPRDGGRDPRDGPDGGDTPENGNRAVTGDDKPGPLMANPGMPGGEGDKSGDDDGDLIETYTAGREPGDKAGGPPGEIEPSPLPPADDGAAPGPGLDHYAHIRSLPTAGQAQRSEAEVVRAYRREMESALGREEIPRLYRQYVKKYFLLIGLREGEDGNVGRK